ncbi:MAG: low molecular weight phosphatase family protein [Actinomycetota bacterium]
MDDPRFHILFVCTGNQCRSALAEVMTRALTAELPVEVSSAGTHAVHPTPSPAESLWAATMLGYDLNAHLSRPLEDAKPEAADLVIGFELGHVATAVVDRDADRTKTFLLPQLVRELENLDPVASGDPVVGARAQVAAAHDRRGSAPPMLEDQIADPMGRSPRTHEEAARTIEALCRALVAGLFPGQR